MFLLGVMAFPPLQDIFPGIWVILNISCRAGKMAQWKMALALALGIYLRIHIKVEREK